MTRVQWHHALHRVWGKSKLVFWFLRFNATYDHEEVLEEIRAALNAFGACAYACYELMGQYDILLRVWVPHGQRDDFERILFPRLDTKGLSDRRSFSVDAVLRHWVWASGPDESGKPVSPPEDFMRFPPGPGQLESLNAIAQRGDEAFADPLFQLFAEKHAIRATPRMRGIKLITAIQVTDEVYEKNISRLGDRLCAALDRSNVARERSLYFGRGGSSRFLLICRIDYTHFHRFRTEVLEDIGREIMATGSIRTLTFPVASPDFLCFEDRLPHGETVEPSPEALLEAGEDQVLEVKGSAFTPLVPWFDGEERAEPPAYPNKTLLRAIASFLNSNDGTVLVGALEPTDYARGKETLGELETVGRFAVCGLVDVTFERDGWDRFALKLESLVADRIDPPPTGRVVVKPKHCLGKPTCVIRIESQPPTDGYFVKGDGAGHFYVRRGGAVHELRGNDIFEYVKQRRERVVAR